EPLSDEEISNLWILLNHTTSALSRHRETELNKFGVSIEQYAVLHSLTDKDGQDINSLAALRLRTHHAIFSLVKRMEKQGLVKTDKNSGSKGYIIFITDKGRNIYGEATIESLKDTFSVLCNDDLRKLSQYLKLLIIRSLSRQGFDYKFPFVV
ncbi:MAG TPA: MarR family winged helix-turn-helix transcriptional regulator, partial [Dehalococcoidales bacterium]|nr:MarR family winged helix-turn-helix transcriptional regulator [Dehalococcoidales bacterium]